MKSIEMKCFEMKQSHLSKHVVELEQCGQMEVFVEGDLDKLKSCSSVFLTIHDVGSSYHSWVTFTSHEDMQETKTRSLFLHVSLPGQVPEDEDLSPDFTFPDLQAISINLVTVLDQLRVSRVVVLGDGAGANIACRFAMFHPSRVHGVVLVNCNPNKGGNAMLSIFKGRKNSMEACKLNLKNVGKYEDAVRKREEILSSVGSKLRVDTLLLAGRKSRTVQGCEVLHTQIKTGLCSIIKLEPDVDNILEETPEKAADAIILFCQGLGLVPTVQRKVSRGSKGAVEDATANATTTKLNMARKLSMEQLDVPNLRRLSLTSHMI